MGGVGALRVLRLLCLLSATSWAFVLRDRARDEDSVERLAEALKVIEQERQRLQQEQAVRDYGRPLQEYWREGEEEDSSPVSEDLLHSLLGEEEDSLPEVLQPERKRSGPSGAASMEELQNILEPSEDERKRSEDKRVVRKKSVPIALGGKGGKGQKREYDPSSEKDKKVVDTTEAEPTQLSEEEVSKLLSAADDAQEEAMEEEAENADDEEKEETDEVSQEELQKVLEEDNTEDVEGNDWPKYPSIPVNINKELLLSQYLQSVPPEDLTRKRKRSEEKRSPIIADDSDQVSIAREYIKKFLELEDDENTNLANALNLATLAQVQRTDKFIPAEVQFLRKAITDEETIQDLKADVEGTAADVVEEEEEEEDIPLERKRADPEDEDIPEVDVPVLEEEPEIVDNDVIADEDEDGMEGYGELSEEDREAFQRFLQQKLQQYLMRSAPSPYDGEGANTFEDSMGKWYNRPVDFNQEGITDEEWQLNPFLRNLYEKYRAGDVRKRTYDDDEEETNDIYEPEEEEEEDEVPQETEADIEDALSNYISQLSQPEGDLLERDMCPAMDLLDDCEFARSLGLRLDGEAMDLCNRHQMCYMCGGAHGLSSDDCDNGYLEEADRLCEGEDDDCKDDAAGLYLLMLKGHAYVEPEDAVHACSAICTTDFIYGLDKK